MPPITTGNFPKLLWPGINAIYGATYTEHKPEWPEIFEFCLKNNKWVEINADPMRLDLPDVLVKDAVKAGVLLTLGTDAHHADMMDNMSYGVS